MRIRTYKTRYGKFGRRITTYKRGRWKWTRVGYSTPEGHQSEYDNNYYRIRANLMNKFYK